MYDKNKGKKMTSQKTIPKENEDDIIIIFGIGLAVGILIGGFLVKVLEMILK